MKVVFKNFPLTYHPFARKAAAAALAAHEQEKFHEYHEKLFENYKALNDALMQAIAVQLGLDLERFNRDMTTASVQGMINRDIRDARALAVRATPTVFINGKLVKERSTGAFVSAIEAELKKER